MTVYIEIWKTTLLCMTVTLGLDNIFVCSTIWRHMFEPQQGMHWQ